MIHLIWSHLLGYHNYHDWSLVNYIKDILSYEVVLMFSFKINGHKNLTTIQTLMVHSVSQNMVMVVTLILGIFFMVSHHPSPYRKTIALVVQKLTLCKDYLFIMNTTCSIFVYYTKPTVHRLIIKLTRISYILATTFTSLLLKYDFAGRYLSYIV